MNKIIIINNQFDYQKFLNKLFIYRSIFCHNIHFEVKDNTENNNIVYIVNALNIKKRKERIDYIFDTSCNIIDEKFRDINICGFQNGKCHVQRKCNKNAVNGCCRNCIYQTEIGCSTKNLACKLFNCQEVKVRYKVVELRDLPLLKVLSLKNQFIIKSDYFSKREDVLKDLYSYSVIWSTIRIIYRLIRNSLNLLKNK